MKKILFTLMAAVVLTACNVNNPEQPKKTYFTLTDKDMQTIATLNQQDAGFINFQDPQFVKYLIETYG